MKTGLSGLLATTALSAPLAIAAFGDAVAKKKLGHSPTTNTLDVNYKSRAPREKDVEASDHLAEMILPFIDRQSA